MLLLPGGLSQLQPTAYSLQPTAYSLWPLAYSLFLHPNHQLLPGYKVIGGEIVPGFNILEGAIVLHRYPVSEFSLFYFVNDLYPSYCCAGILNHLVVTGRCAAVAKYADLLLQIPLHLISRKNQNRPWTLLRYKIGAVNRIQHTDIFYRQINHG